MNVAELIAQLEKIEDKTQDVRIAVRQYNKSYPIGYLPILDLGGRLENVGDEVRIYTNLPDNMRTMVLKKN